MHVSTFLNLLLWFHASRKVALASTRGIDPLSTASTPPQSNHMMYDRDIVDPSLKFVFSDIDGTLVHYHHSNNLTEEEISSLVFLPPSATGLKAHISINTLRLCQDIRKMQSVILVLVSGMRTKTLFQRIPYLPRADVYVSENGGRIFYPISLEEDEEDITCTISTPIRKDTTPILLHVKPVIYDGISFEDKKEFGIVEDLAWKHYIRQLPQQLQESHATQILESDVSNVDQSSYEEELLHSLQIVEELLEKRNFKIDKLGYSTCIRVDWKQQRQDLVTKEDFDQLYSSIDLNRLGLQCSFNLGCIDFFPWKSGKKNCCEYIAEKFTNERKTTSHQKQESIVGGAEILASSLCVCDDDNDIPLSLACRKTFLPTVSSQSMKELVESREERIIVTEDIPNGIVGFMATEAALRRVLDEL